MGGSTLYNQAVCFIDSNPCYLIEHKTMNVQLLYQLLFYYTDSLRTLPKHYPFLATLSAEEWTQIAMEEVCSTNTDHVIIM